MAITQTLLSMDEYFRTTQGDKIIVNDLNYFSIQDIESLNSNLMTIYDTETLSTVPVCDCGSLKGRYLLGKVCSDCGATVKEPHRKVEPLLWLKTLDMDIRFMNPTFWIMLKVILHRKLDYVRWLSDPKYNPPNKLPPYMVGTKDVIPERSYPALIEHLPNLLIYFQNHSHFKKDPEKVKKLELLHNMYLTQKDRVFSTFLPIVNKKLFVMENTTKGKFTNLAVADVIDIVMLWTKTVSDEKLTLKKANAITGSVVAKFANLFQNYFDKYLTKKPGAFRKHVYGARSHFTFRTVIISIGGPHDHREIHAPWAMGVTAFRPHILNKLVNKRGYTYKDASKLLFKSVKHYDSVIDEILNELIDESPYPVGIPVLATRNPSLLQGSSQLLYISKFNRNPETLTLAISLLIAKSPNADFDGNLKEAHKLVKK